MATTQKTSFVGQDGQRLAARLDLPSGPVRGYALFAHCFTCSKDLVAARRISQGLAQEGFGVLRFDFTGLGSSEGEFENTHFHSNVQDLIAAADHLRQAFAAPVLLVGHSLGGAAVLAAAPEIPEVRAVATVGAPADVGHVLKQFGSSLDAIRSAGRAEVQLAGRPFTISRRFVEEAEGARLEGTIRELKRALLVLHSPIDDVVGIDNASQIFQAARHPKSFVSLDGADHLVSKPADAAYVADVISAWARRFVPEWSVDESAPQAIVVEENGLGKFANAVQSGRHRLLADEPMSVGGLDTGPSPYDYLSIALGACTSMTLRMYAGFKKMSLGRVRVTVTHGKVAADHCADCEGIDAGRGGKIDRFERQIQVDGPVDEALRNKLLEIADKCPVHRTLEGGALVVTTVAGDEEGDADGGI